MTKTKKNQIVLSLTSYAQSTFKISLKKAYFACTNSDRNGGEMCRIEYFRNYFATETDLPKIQRASIKFYDSFEFCIFYLVEQTERD